MRGLLSNVYASLAAPKYCLPLALKSSSMLSDDGLGLAEGVAVAVAEGLPGRLPVGSAVGTAMGLVVALEMADEDAVDAVEDEVPNGVDGIDAVG